MKKSRRAFLKNTVKGSAALMIGSMLPGMSAKSYASILGANDRIRVGMMGVNARGLALATNYARQPNCEVISVSDVDTRAAEKCIEKVKEVQQKAPVAIPDFRKALENKDLDALVIAA